MENGITMKLKVDPEQLAALELQVQKINADITAAGEDFIDGAKNLKTRWVSPAGAGFLQNMALPVAQDLVDLEEDLKNRCIEMQTAAGIYREAEETATAKAETLPTDIMF